MDIDLILSLVQALVSALTAVPHPAVVASAIALGAVITVYRKYRATKAVDPAEVAAAAKAVKAAADVMVPKAPVAPVEPKFDADSFGGMTAAEKAKK